MTNKFVKLNIGNTVASSAHRAFKILSAGGGDLPAVGTSLEDCTWEQISAISAAGKGEEYFKVGDTKSVYLSGTVGTLALDTTLYVYIIGFSHNGSEGITFGTFKTADGVDVGLVDSNYSSTSTDGSKWFNMNHWGNYNYGGWSASDIRYDILGSTDVAPSNYGAARTTTDVGYDATATCATNPVEGTLMAALPTELRSVMKPMTIYTDNTGNSSNVETNVTATVDYLPLLAEYEIFGARTYANQYEQNKQAQYEYFANGNSRIKYKHTDTTAAAYWWERSAGYFSYNSFCNVITDGSASDYYARSAFALAPAFLV